MLANIFVNIVQKFEKFHNQIRQSRENLARKANIWPRFGICWPTEAWSLLTFFGQYVVEIILNVLRNCLVWSGGTLRKSCRSRSWSRTPTRSRRARRRSRTKSHLRPPVTKSPQPWSWQTSRPSSFAVSPLRNVTSNQIERLFWRLGENVWPMVFNEIRYYFQ